MFVMENPREMVYTGFVKIFFCKQTMLYLTAVFAALKEEKV